MVYHNYELPLTEEQVKRLVHGQAVKIAWSEAHAKPEQFKLTTTQIKRLNNAKASGRSLTLKFSDAQVKYNSKHGGSLFTDIFDKIKGGVGSAYRTVAPLARDAAKYVADNYGDTLINAATAQAGKQLDSLVASASHAGQRGLSQLPSGEARSVAESLLSKGLSLGDSLARSELKAFLEGVKRSQSGSGLFDFIPVIGDALNSVGNLGFDVVKAVGPGLIKSQLGFGARRGRGRPRKLGMGLYPPGSY